MGNNCCRPTATRPAGRPVNVTPKRDDTGNPGDIGGCTSACSDGKSTARLSKLGLQLREITEDFQNESHQENLEQLKLILFGPVGNGKSALGNIITQANNFKRRSFNTTTIPYTQQIQCKTVVRPDIPLEVVVVDTPGIQEYLPYGSGITGKEVYSIELQKMMLSAINQAGGRDHLYVFVISLQQKLNPDFFFSIQKVLHIVFDKHIIVVYTNSYNISEENSRERMLQLFPWEFRRWVTSNNIPHRIMNINYDTYMDTLTEDYHAEVVNFLKYCNDYVKDKIHERQKREFSPFRNSLNQPDSFTYISVEEDST